LPGHHGGSQQALTDRRDFHITRKALEDLGLSAAETCDIFKVLSASATIRCNSYRQVVAAVLKLGNLNFVPLTNMDGTEGCRVENEYELYDVGELVSVEVDSLRTALLARTVSAGSDSVVAELSAGEAETGRDALCRTLYSRLFTLLVSRINEAIKVLPLLLPMFVHHPLFGLAAIGRFRQYQIKDIILTLKLFATCWLVSCKVTIVY
jgi:myosin heavy subunit